MARLLERNPGSAHYHDNERYNTSRGYFFRDAGGNWRTPDGTRFASASRAESYNDNRREHLRAIDAVNALRSQGIDARLKDVKEAMREAASHDHFLSNLSDDYPDFDASDFFDDYYDGDTP